MTGLSIRAPARGFALASSTSSAPSSNVDSDDDAPLPFPAALPRADFLTPDFHPAAYLSSLPHRHQTLDDLKSDLRERSAAISAELLDLVNGNYTSFLSLGDDLRGGDDKAEGVKVAMLGFRRQVDEVKARVRDRREEIEGLTGELRTLRQDIEAGRRMLELDDRLAGLEEHLAIGSLPGKEKMGKEKAEDDGWSVAASDVSSDEEEDDDYEGLVGSSPAQLAALAAEYCVIEALADAVGRDKPFVIKAEARMTRCRNTLLLDLGTALKEARKAGERGKARVMKYLGLYGMLDAEGEAIKVLKGV
ncbi:hypothetical protein SODALDRAFT_329674 [Sodiomyces alkalinus F11]|uniref:Conserved oligomeric Golgi complex subunit 2 n=1 Tax=Sodiomyces alkalinus (strain CBS 110278 / VKM F-3762 / F11) TaxID=1314773 RepID=A0A3N2PJ52_SODAK|nr:hypothetical protein SODALDRAFT_329674 [Sodiomyces alkalinus F11]ROT34568.1 hypothetical protein SODALDRAFT_329674 [Sodiomyces alkalinus F11]